MERTIGYIRQVREDVVVRDVDGEKGVNTRQDRVMPLTRQSHASYQTYADEGPLHTCLVHA